MSSNLLSLPYGDSGDATRSQAAARCQQAAASKVCGNFLPLFLSLSLYLSLPIYLAICLPAKPSSFSTGANNNAADALSPSAA